MTASSPVAIEVRDLQKTFRVASPEPRGLGSRLLHPIEVKRPRQLRVLDGISFDVGRGEFFGIVGRNGSGKSTLLRTISGIYRVNGGTIRVAGRVAPLIELGIGFEQELSARENVVLNGVVLGLTPTELRRRADEVLEFAEVREFGDVPLKNFSSGMRIRLAFAIMIRADPDILLVDEILAVGDAGFRQKCTETFLKLKAAGRTIVLVSHVMHDVKQYCDRAMLLEAGRILEIGDPDRVAERYFEVALQHRERGAARGPAPKAVPAQEPVPRVHIAELQLSSNGSSGSLVDERIPLQVDATVEVERPIRVAGIRLEIRTEHGALVFAPPDPSAPENAPEFGPGDRLRARAIIENRLSAGRYTLSCVLLHVDGEARIGASPVRSIPFEVVGNSQPGTGLVSLEHTVHIEPEGRTGA